MNQQFAFMALPDEAGKRQVRAPGGQLRPENDKSKIRLKSVFW
jgi:hypothetical protein